MTQRLRHFLARFAIVALFFVAISQDVLAQAPTQPTPAPSNVTKQSRPFYVEGAVVVLLMAAAGYAVCRSSRRV